MAHSSGLPSTLTQTADGRTRCQRHITQITFSSPAVAQRVPAVGTCLLPQPRLVALSNDFHIFASALGEDHMNVPD